MNKRLFICALLLSLFLCGCLGFEFYTVKITMNDKKSDEITVQMKNIFSTEDSLKKQQEDFESVILDFYKGDNFLLDQVNEGIYVKDRRLFEENGMLIFEFSGIFRDFKIDKEPLKKVDGKWCLCLSDLGEYDLYQTNGEIVKIDSVTHITWPADKKELTFEFKLKEIEKEKEKVYSLLPFYKKWMSGELSISED